MDGSIVRSWADMEQCRFKLGIGQLRELQEKTNSGPPEVFYRLGNHTWRVDDIRETIRLGLIGGGHVTPADALVKVVRYVDNRPLMENAEIALSIIGAALLGDPMDQPEAGKEQTEKTNGSASPSSMVTEPSLDSLQGRLML
jgi:hypothetical protein